MCNSAKDVTWNKNFWDKTQTKAIQGLCAIGIVFHHMAQKTCAPWLPQEYIVHGLDPFLYLGYLFVGVFFFCSGYGLYKSLKAKENYLDGFIGNHYRPLILLYLISQFCYYMTGQVFSQYVWFIYAIMYLYLAFYISFKCFKNEKASIVSLAVFILLYIVICELLVAGTWCYNTVGIFLVGLLFAKNTDKIVSFIRQKFVFNIILWAVILAAGFYGAIQFNKQIYLTDNEAMYYLWRYVTVAVQFAASTAFSILLFVLSQKIRLKGKVFDFLGSITLELYLIHVLFVEVFGYCFVNIDIGAKCYIPNIFLYTLVVLLLSLVSAYALFWLRKGARIVREKCKDYLKKLKRNLKIALIVILCVLAGITVLLIFVSRSGDSAKKEKADKYIEENITFVDVGNDSKMAAYVTGDGEKTIVILRGWFEPCPTITQKALADELASDYKVVVLDYLGSGFSSNALRERNIQNICEEIHSAVLGLGIENYSLLAEEESAYYTLYYVNEYPGEVESVITVELQFAGLEKEIINLQNASIFDYKRQQIKSSNGMYFGYRLLYYSGLRVLVWPFFQELYSKSAGQKYDDVASYVFLKKVMNKTVCDERKQALENILATENLKYPSNVQVIDLVNSYKINSLLDYDIDIAELLSERCEDKSKQTTVPLFDAMYCISHNTPAIKEIILSNQIQ